MFENHNDHLTQVAVLCVYNVHCAPWQSHIIHLYSSRMAHAARTAKQQPKRCTAKYIQTKMANNTRICPCPGQNKVYILKAAQNTHNNNKNITTTDSSNSSSSRKQANAIATIWLNFMIYARFIRCSVGMPLRLYYVGGRHNGHGHAQEQTDAII